MKQIVNRAVQREAYRLWFEFLRLAIKSQSPDIKIKLKGAGARYVAWGAVEQSTFNAWWAKYKGLFQRPETVLLPKSADGTCEWKWHESIVIEIPLNESVTRLTARVREVIQENDKRVKGGKAHFAQGDTFSLTPGSEPKLGTIRNYLTVYRDVHLANPSLKGGALLKAVRDYYGRRARKRGIPSPLQTGGGYGTDINALRNLNRYLQKAEAIVNNVARGEFPGKY